MTYAVGGLIQASDYNGFVETSTPNLNRIWSTGFNSSGYGQTALSQVNVGDTIDNNEWSNLLETISKSAQHQGTTITAISSPSAGDIISFYAALQANLNSIDVGRLNAVAVGTDIVGTNQRTGDWGGGAGIPELESVITVTFGNDNQARYFFNAGGTVRINCSRTGGTGTPQDLIWTQLCGDIGTLVLPAVNTPQTIAGTAFNGFTKIGGGGTLPDIYNRQGYYQLNAASQTLFRQVSGSDVYTNDDITVSATRVANTVVLRVLFVDRTSSGSPDTVTGTLTVTATARLPSTTVLSPSWGTPTVTVTAPSPPTP